jgi:hypothetical protein
VASGGFPQSVAPISAFCFRLVVALGGKLIPVEICQLSLWIKTAACGKQLTSLDHTINGSLATMILERSC